VFALEILASIGSVSGITSIRFTIMPTPSNIAKMPGGLVILSMIFIMIASPSDKTGSIESPRIFSKRRSAGLPIQTVLHVIGIALRDAIFADRELNAEKVDEHDPHFERLE